MRVKVLFLVNGAPDGPMGQRARELASRLTETIDWRISFRSANKALSIAVMLFRALAWRPRICYVFDMGYSGVIAAAAWRTLTGGKVVVDTGDSISALMSLTGNRGTLGLFLTRRLERLALDISDHLITRSHPHSDRLTGVVPGITVIPDGVDVRQFARGNNSKDPKPRLLVGMLGSIVWNRLGQTCYGWELLEALAILRDEPVDGLIIGDGSGLPFLKARCAELGLTDRLKFCGRVPYEELPAMLPSIDVCLSTQTNDEAGQVRTTGKLPLYLASGCFVLASDVGEAALILPSSMLVRYDGTKDIEYPARLADRIRGLLRNPEPMACAVRSAEIAAANFDYDLLAKRLQTALLAVAQSPRKDGIAGRVSPTQ